MFLLHGNQLIRKNSEIPLRIAANSSLYMDVLLGVHPFNNLEIRPHARRVLADPKLCVLDWKEVY